MVARDATIAAYIMASRRNGTLYVGVTSELSNRVWQHKNGAFSGFTEEHGCKMLVWYELFPDMPSAIRREKNLKKWLRNWKLELIEKENPEWRDLSDGWHPESSWDFDGSEAARLAPPED
jgi:putative endonuclease